MFGIQTFLVCILAVSVSYIEAKGTNEAKDVKPEGRIIGGELAIPGEFPHHVLVYQNTSADNTMGNICGGSLLSEEWVLTAAHCVTNKPGANGLDAFFIIAGRYFGPANNGRDPVVLEQTKKVQKIFIHKCYLGEEIDPLINNDVALIKLVTPFTLNDRVKLIQLDEDNRANNGTQTTAIGWGISNPMSKEFPPALKKATLFISEESLCEQIIQYINMESQICLNETDSVCSGDSGGPLLCNDEGINYLCGIASLADSTQGISVFVRVFHFKDWIKEVMGSESNSDRECVTPKVTRTTTESVILSRIPLTITIEPNSGAEGTFYKQPLVEFYMGTILVSFLWTL